MEFCFEYFRCDKRNCPNWRLRRHDCWNVEDTECAAFPKDMVEDIGKKTLCRACLYYQEVKRRQPDKFPDAADES